MRGLTVLLAAWFLLSGTTPAVPDPAREPGRVLDEAGILGADGVRRLEALGAGGAPGEASGRLWVKIIPESADLKQALEGLGAQVGPEPGDLVVVASRKGVMARAPGLAADRGAIDRAFKECRPELSRDLVAGLVTFITKLRQAEAGVQTTGSVLMVAVGVGVLAVLIYLLAQHHRFARDRARWDEDDRRAHLDRVGRCQELLQGRARDGRGDEDFVTRYQELERLKLLAPGEARADLERLLRALEGGGGGPL